MNEVNFSYTNKLYGIWNYLSKTNNYLISIIVGNIVGAILVSMLQNIKYALIYCIIIPADLVATKRIEGYYIDADTNYFSTFT